MIVIINYQCRVVNRKELDQTASYQFEPGLNRSISVTNSIDSGGILEFSCCIGSVLAATVYPEKYQALQAYPKNIYFSIS